MGIIDKTKNRIKDWIGESSGTAGEEYTAGIREPRPYSQYYMNGLFRGNDQRKTLWLYFKMPVDVKVEWTKTYRESAHNQEFLSNIFNILGRSIQNTTESTKKDNRIRFHIPVIRELSNEIHGFDDMTPATEDFMKRMSETIRAHPVWHSYLGIEVPVGSINADVTSLSDKARNYIDFMFGEADFEYHLYKEYIELITSACLDNGLRPLDFASSPEDFDRLVGWFGQTDPKYGIRPELATTPMQVPSHGKSIFVGGQEMMVSAIRPKEARDIFSRDPFDAAQVRFGEVFLRPDLDIVHINIRGEIRSPSAAANMFDDKTTKTEYRQMSGADHIENSSVGDRKKLAENAQFAEIAEREASQFQFAFLDNVEMTVTSIVDERPNMLNAALDPFQLEAVNITERQHIALTSTVPAYPNSIFKVPAGNARRNPNVRNFYSGVLSMSGLFRSTKPAAPQGILVGLSEAGYELKEIYIDSNSTTESPTILVTGSTGSGKTVELLMMSAQANYMGHQVIFLNPKPQSSLENFFDLMDGETINMSNKYLRERPGLLDPMFYLKDRESVGRLLADMIIRAQGMNAKSNSRTDMVRSMEEITAELVSHAKMPANETSYDIIFGNKRHNANTPRLSDDETVSFVRTKMETSPFWKASISKDPGARNNFKELFENDKPLLVEWDDSIVLPQPGTNPDMMTTAENDGVQSIINLFMFSSDIIGKKLNGGMLIIDEAYILKNSEMIMKEVVKSGRTWRSMNISLVLSTQHLSDFLTADEDDDTDSDMGSYIRTFIIMNIDETDTKDLKIFYKLSKLPRDEDNTSYITHMKRNTARRKFIPSAYVIDNVYNWEGSIMCGPWPQRELKATDPKRDVSEDLKGNKDQLEEMSRVGGFFNTDISDEGNKISEI